MFSQLRTFQCPQCREVVNESMERCPFCSNTIDHQAAVAAAEVQERVNRSYSDASYSRSAAVAMLVFLGLSFVPLIPVVYWGFLATFVVVIVMVIRWQVRFGRLRTEDPDYRQAVYRKNLALVLWLLAIPLGFILRPTITAVLYELLLAS